MAAFGVEVAVIEKIWKATDFYLFIYIFFLWKPLNYLFCSWLTLWDLDMALRKVDNAFGEFTEQEAVCFVVQNSIVFSNSNWNQILFNE